MFSLWSFDVESTVRDATSSACEGLVPAVAEVSWIGDGVDLFESVFNVDVRL